MNVIITDIETIRQTLDYDGCIDGVYFTIEMEEFCGKELTLKEPVGITGIRSWKVYGNAWTWTQEWFNQTEFLKDEDFEV